MRLLSIALLGIVCLAQAQAQTDLSPQLRSLPHVIDVKTSPGRNGATVYDITFQQPVDHKNPGGPKFGQHAYLVHTGFDKPVVLGTEGYNAGGPGGGEPARILKEPNILTVEHRYFGKSIPNPIDWPNLTIKNAADDMHEIVTSFKGLYKGKWVAMGYSKGGQTALFFKCFYPNDVDATIAYVAPINVAQEDPRIYRFFATVSDEATRNKIRDFQIALLKREDEVLAQLKPNPSDYSMGVAKAYEYGVLEFPFAMFQYGSKPEGIPAPDAKAEDLAAMYRKVNAMYYYSDEGIKAFEAFQYQAFTEIGYYNYDTTELKPYLKNNPNPTNMDLCPPGTKEKVVYNPATLAFVYNYLQYKANNVIYVYGEQDPWSATQVELIGRTNAVKIMVKGAWHNASIRLASPEQRDKVFDALQSWLGPINRF